VPAAANHSAVEVDGFVFVYGPSSDEAPSASAQRASAQQPGAFLSRGRPRGCLPLGSLESNTGTRLSAGRRRRRKAIFGSEAGCAVLPGPNPHNNPIDGCQIGTRCPILHAG
jgi:hypothetical protein